MTDTLFQDIVGQETAKSTLSFYLNSYQKTLIMPNLLFCAPKGQGKTTIARETAKGLFAYDDNKQVLMKEDGITPKKKTFLETNASSLKTVNSFINWLVDDVVDKNVTVFIDEASEIKKDVGMIMLTLLNPNPSNRNSYTHNGLTVDIDFSKQTFIFATSEPHRVENPLIDRLTRIDLQDYSYFQLAEILRRPLKDISFDDGLDIEIATTLRGNARQAMKRANEIRAYLCGGKHFSFNDWNNLKTTLGILPLGLNLIELSLLRYMKDSINGSSLTNLAAKTGLSRESVMKDYEIWLQRCSLMEITAGKGRTITAKGLQYLKELQKSAV